MKFKVENRLAKNSVIGKGRGTDVTSRCIPYKRKFRKFFFAFVATFFVRFNNLSAVRTTNRKEKVLYSAVNYINKVCHLSAKIL